jgi:RimJ/RimL family protein N-acetyltransferase
MTIRDAPRIETERLVLRQWRGDDYRPYFDIMAEPKVFEHVGGKPIDDEEAMRRLSMYAGFWTIQGIGMWAVEDLATNRLVGQVGLFNIHRALDPHPPGRFEMGWIFTTDCHGRGLARESCDAALGWLNEQYSPTDLFAIIALDNQPSMKLAERLGFRREPDATYKDAPISCWYRPA